MAHGLGYLAACGNLSSWIRDRTHVPCLGRQTLNRWTTREVLTGTVWAARLVQQRVGQMKILQGLAHEAGPQNLSWV